VACPGATSVAPADGTLLWEHAWEGAAMLQPARVSEDDVLVTAGDMMGGMGTKRLAVAHGPAGWTASERWTSRGLKPYFNDLVVHDGHAYGFDGNILACIDLADGQRKWKGGRYGNGQLVLLEDQHLLLVLSEEGELALVEATPDQFTEIARVPAIQGKTWNHPALVGDVLLVALGVPLPALWALLVFAASFIPNVGTILALVPPTILALLDSGPGAAGVVVVGFTLINFAQDYLLQPRLMGMELNLSPLVIFASIIVWAWILGPAGALLAVPLTVVITFAPPQRASSIAAWPTAPAPPVTRIHWPLMGPSEKRQAWAVMAGMPRHAPAANSVSSGSSTA